MKSFIVWFQKLCNLGEKLKTMLNGVPHVAYLFTGYPQQKVAQGALTNEACHRR
jgi:hypothetical protein